MAQAFLRRVFQTQPTTHFKKPFLVCSRRFYSPTRLSYDPEEVTELKFPTQTVFAGKNSLDPFIEAFRSTGNQKPLIISDPGLSKTGVIHVVQSEMESQGLTPEVFDSTQPNPSTKDVINIAQTFWDSGCDSCVGLGGGGPLDATKIAMLLVAKKRLEKDQFDIIRNGAAFVSDELRPLLKSEAEFLKSIPLITGIPTTAGTGSEGGKSAVITLDTGKVVIGHPSLMPKYVALVPQLTENLPPHLTAATGMDALFHCVEAFFVPFELGLADGLTPEEIEYCDNYAKKGALLVINNLPKAMERPSDLTARLNLQVGALCGAKAFRKADLGAIHATAHALGSKYHLHHGTAIARMSVPVIRHNESKINDEQKSKFELIRSMFADAGFAGETLSATVSNFLKPLNLPFGLDGLEVLEADVEELTDLATNDGCQTNVVRLGRDDYNFIFRSLFEKK